MISGILDFIITVISVMENHGGENLEFAGFDLTLFLDSRHGGEKMERTPGLTVRLVFCSN
jgi:hypothetical protein